MLKEGIHPVQCIGRRLAAEFQYDALEKSAATPLPLHVVQNPILPAFGRARVHAGRHAGDAVIERRDERFGFIERHEPRFRLHGDGREGCRPLARDVDLGRHGGHAVAELAVDCVLRRPQCRYGLPARVSVIDQRTLQRAQIAAAAMGRQHTGDGHTGGPHLPARYREIERKRSGAGDDPVTVEASMHPLVRQHAREMLDRVVGWRILAEIVPDRRHRGAAFVRVGAGSNLHGVAFRNHALWAKAQ